MSTTIGDAIKAARQSAGITQRQLSQILGYRGIMTVSGIETGNRLIPPHMVEAFAKALSVDPIELLDLLPDDDRYRVIREKVNQAVAFQNPKSNLKPLKMTKELPLYVINAGWRPLIYEDPVGYIPIPDELMDKLGDRGVACVVDGDSMEPFISDGDVVIADRGLEPEKGHVCVCCICHGADNPDNLATLKAVFFTKEGQIRLVPANMEYEAETINAREAASVELWPVIYHVRRYKKTRGLRIEIR